MNFRYPLCLGVAFTTIAGMAHAQSRQPSREDLLDQLSRHIQLCSEITDTQQRLACYDKVQNNVGGAPTPQPVPQTSSRPPAPSPAPSPSPPQSPPPAPSAPAPSGSGSSYGATPLTPPPLTTPGGGVATLGGSQGQPNPPPVSDPDRAFDPHGAASSYGPADATMPKPRPPVRRTGARPIPNSGQPMPLVSLTASNLTYGESRYWQVSISVTSNTPNTVDAQIQCTFRNAGRSVGDAYFGPIAIAPGEQISTELIGPPTTTYVDSTNCRVVGP
jgi:hypothetical protein